MPEKHDLLAAILAAKEHQADLRLQWRTFAADIMAVRLQKAVIWRNVCAIIALDSFVTSTSPD